MVARLTAHLDALLRIHPHERAPLLWLMLYATAAIGGVLTIGYSVAAALFLSQLPASATALIFAVTGAAVTITILGYNRLSAHVRIAPLVIASSLILALLTLVLRGLLATPVGDELWLLLLLNLFSEVSLTLVIMQSWSYAAQVFDPRQARRLFGIFTVGGTAANMVAGLLLSVLVGLIGTANLLYLVAASLLICGLCAWALRPWLPESVPVSASGAGSSLLSDLRSIATTPLLRSISALTVLLSLLVTVPTYQFFLTLQVTFGGSDDAMTSYLGYFEFASGLAALLLHLFISRWLIRERGLFLAMLVLPVAVVLGSGWALATGGSLLAVALVYAVDPVLRRTLSDASMNVLFLPLPAGLRSRSKELMEVVYALSFSLAGLVFLLVQRLPGWRTAHWSYPLLALAIGWWLLSPGVRSNYLRALSESLRFRRLEPGTGTLELSDEASVALLRRALEDDDDLRVLHVLTLLADATDTGWTEWVRPLLGHALPIVRQRALAFLRARAGLSSGGVAELLDDPDEGVRAAAVEALCELQGAEATPQMALLLESAAPAVRVAALVGSLLWGGAKGYELAAPRLEAMAASSDPAERAGAAEILGRLHGEGSVAALARLLRDADMVVRRTAVRAAVTARRPELVPALVVALGHPATAPGAGEALIAQGERVVPALQQAFAGPGLAPAARIRVLETLAVVGAAAGEAFVLTRLEEPEPEVRSAVYRALTVLRSDHPSRRPLLEGRLEDEAREAYRVALMRSDLLEPLNSELLSEALERLAQRELRRLLWLCAALYPGSGLAEAAGALGLDGAGADPRLIEMLDTALAPEFRGLILPLFEGSAEQLEAVAVRRLGLRHGDPERILEELVAGDDAWLAACALFEIGERGYRGLDASVAAALASEVPLLRETALASVRRLFSAGRVAREAVGHRDDPDASVRGYARSLLAEGGAA